MVSNIYAKFYLVVQSITKINNKSVLKNTLFAVRNIRARNEEVDLAKARVFHNLIVNNQSKLYKPRDSFTCLR